jgi:uncharacterized Zn finger protein (UPF0148 family)
MEKYAVREDVNQEHLEKIASQGCPKCGKSLEKHGRVLRCPIHGTEPFEGAEWQPKEMQGKQQ